jgi:hypothetical protein
MNWKGCGRKRSWPNFRYYPGIFLEGLKKTTKNLSQESRFAGRDLNAVRVNVGSGGYMFSK